MAQSKREETKGSKTKGRDIANTIPPPPGFDSKPLEHTKQATKRDHKADLNELKSKKIYELAIGPAKSIPMNAFMSYMTGNSLQIIPVTMTMMLLWNPIKAIFNDLNPTFLKLKQKTTCCLSFCQIGVYILSVDEHVYWYLQIIHNGSHTTSGSRLASMVRGGT